jgi:predicted KAP-like P-loop ATPase
MLRNPGERHVTDYLDKLIQMPVRVPLAGVQEVRAYLFLLLTSKVVTDAKLLEKLRTYLIERLRLSWKDEDSFDVDDALNIVDRKGDDSLRLVLEMADRMAPMLAHATRVQGNPRIVKRLLNVVRMRASIANKRKMPLDEAIIAKLALFERCTDTNATEALHDAINAARAGTPNLLREVEGAESEEELKKRSPEAWQKHLLFLAEWVQLDPKLAGVDLRPAVYLARETVPLRLSPAAFSPKALRAVESLLRTATISSKGAAEAIAGLDSAEHILVMEQLVAEMRKNPVWDKVRPDFRGALLLARSSADAAKIFSRFIRSLPHRPLWMKAHIKDEDWFEE